MSDWEERLNKARLAQAAGIPVDAVAALYFPDGAAPKGEDGPIVDSAAQRAEILRLRQGIWDMMAALGLDTDGDATPEAQTGDLAEMGVAFAKEARKDYEDLLDEEDVFRVRLDKVWDLASGWAKKVPADAEWSGDTQDWILADAGREILALCAPGAVKLGWKP